MTLGFSKKFGHAFDSVWANDFDDACVRTYRANFGEHCVLGDIVDILNDPETQIPSADVVIGGPPCQGFSLLNKNRQGDPRKQLWRPFLDVVERSGAGIFVMENVPQLLGSFEHGEIIGTAERMGFKCWGEILCAADYGVPQTRLRAFIVGCKFFDPSRVFPPRKTHFDPRRGGAQLSLFQADANGYLPGALRWRTVRDAIGDLPEPEGIEIRDEDPPLDLHFGRSPTERSIARYKAIPKEGMNRFDLQKRAPELTPECWLRKKTGGTDLFGRLWWDRPAFTIRTEFFKPEKGRYLHPEQHRPITHREAARLQSFPDEFIFKGSKIEIARQIGNAVPPLLAARVADVVYLLLTMNEH
jgi:DNA (cytosine-5)-methyltransferase 1